MTKFSQTIKNHSLGHTIYPIFPIFPWSMFNQAVTVLYPFRVFRGLQRLVIFSVACIVMCRKIFVVLNWILIALVTDDFRGIIVWCSTENNTFSSPFTRQTSLEIFNERTKDLLLYSMNFSFTLLCDYADGARVSLVV